MPLFSTHWAGLYSWDPRCSVILFTRSTRRAGIWVELTDGVAEKCVRQVDPVYGARPLKRAIQVHLENPLAEALLKGQFALVQPSTVLTLPADAQS